MTPPIPRHAPQAAPPLEALGRRMDVAEARLARRAVDGPAGGALGDPAATVRLSAGPTGEGVGDGTDGIADAEVARAADQLVDHALGLALHADPAQRATLAQLGWPARYPALAARCWPRLRHWVTTEPSIELGTTRALWTYLLPLTPRPEGWGEVAEALLDRRPDIVTLLLALHQAAGQCPAGTKVELCALPGLPGARRTRLLLELGAEVLSGIGRPPTQDEVDVLAALPESWAPAAGAQIGGPILHHTADAATRIRRWQAWLHAHPVGAAAWLAQQLGPADVPGAPALELLDALSPGAWRHLATRVGDHEPAVRLVVSLHAPAEVRAALTHPVGALSHPAAVPGASPGMTPGTAAGTPPRGVSRTKHWSPDACALLASWLCSAAYREAAAWLYAYLRSGGRAPTGLLASVPGEVWRSLVGADPLDAGLRLTLERLRGHRPADVRGSWRTVLERRPGEAAAWLAQHTTADPVWVEMLVEDLTPAAWAQLLAAGARDDRLAIVDFLGRRSRGGRAPDVSRARAGDATARVPGRD